MQTSSSNQGPEVSPNASSSGGGGSSDGGGGGGEGGGFAFSAKAVVARSELGNCGNSTTFVQADTASFKYVVQMLTGCAEMGRQVSGRSTAEASRNPMGPMKPAFKKQGFKLYERRAGVKLCPLHSSSATTSSSRNPEILSPSLLDFPSLVLSPVTPLIPDPFGRRPAGLPSGSSSAAEEERTIAEKGFYLHPSPVNTTGDPQPRLLPLFPVSSSSHS